MEGIVKTITVDPAKLVSGGNKATSVIVKVYFDAAALAALYENAGSDPELITVPYIINSEEWGIDLESMNLAEAAATGHEVSSFATINAAHKEL